MTVTRDSQRINVHSTAQEKIDYMRDLLETLQGLDTNIDGRISTDELVNDDIKKYLEYRERAFRPEANTDPLKDLREDLAGALKGDATARYNVAQALSSISAQNPKDLRDALEMAATLTGTARDTPRQKPVKPEVEQSFQDMMATIKRDGNYTPELEAQMRSSLGLPPQQADAEKAQQQQRIIADLGKQLAQFQPEKVEAAPTMQQLAVGVNAASQATRGTGRSGQ